MNNAEGTKFFIMLPVDKWGNTVYGNDCVIEATVEKREIWEGDRLTIIAPDKFAVSWPAISGRIGNTFGASYLEVEGPARRIEIEEWGRLIFNSGDDQLKKIISLGGFYIPPEGV